ncbi:unnamed protein product [Ascophyllum nodosum]
MRIMRQRTCTGVLALTAALALEVVGVQGRFRWRRNSDEAGTGFAVIPAAPGLGCLVGDQFTLTGFPGKTAYDGCYMGSRSEHGFPHYTLNGQQTESSGGLIVSAPDYDNSSQLVYWAIREEGGTLVCGGSRLFASVDEAHPTRVSSWRCYGGIDQDRELPVKVAFSLSCGCSASGGRVRGLKGMAARDLPTRRFDGFIVSAFFAGALLACSMKCWLKQPFRRTFKPANSVR